MYLAAAFLLGFVGSLHCAVMCGPLLLAIPTPGKNKTSFLFGRLVYHSGRLATYAAIGLVSGLLGRAIELAGLQRWLSIIAGTIILIGLFASSRLKFGAIAGKAILRLK